MKKKAVMVLFVVPVSAVMSASSREGFLIEPFHLVNFCDPASDIECGVEFEIETD